MGSAADRFRACAAQIMRAAEHARRIPVIEARRVHWCRGHRRLEPDGRWSYRIRMVDPMPRGKQITTWGWSEQECIARMHWAIALHYKRSGPDKDLDRCLDRSAEDSVRVMEWETVR